MDRLLFGGLRITKPRSAIPPLKGQPILLPSLLTSVGKCCGGCSLPTMLLSPHRASRERAFKTLTEDIKALRLTDDEALAIMERSERTVRDVPGLCWPDAISDLGAARALLDVLPPDHPWLVLGVAMEANVAAEYIASGVGKPGLAGGTATLLGALTAMPPGGQFLGFELLTLDSEISFGCSGFCCRVEQEVFRHLGIRPNGHGLIETVEDARTAARRTTDDGWGEPLPHWPVALFDFTKAARRAECP